MCFPSDGGETWVDCVVFVYLSWDLHSSHQCLCIALILLKYFTWWRCRTILVSVCACVVCVIVWVWHARVSMCVHLRVTHCCVCVNARVYLHICTCVCGDKVIHEDTTLNLSREHKTQGSNPVSTNGKVLTYILSSHWTMYVVSKHYWSYALSNVFLYLSLLYYQEQWWWY